MSVGNLAYSVCRLLWRDVGLRRITALRSGWALLIRLWLIARERSALDAAHFDQIYSQNIDPWGYRVEAQQERYRRALQSLPDKTFSRALEIGCGEGMFTTLLAERCTSVLAADISPVALARAQARCGDVKNSSFLKWDLRQDALPGTFDLITAMDVLGYYPAPITLRRVRDKIVDAIVPGGYLLVTTPKAHDFIEKSLWARRLYCGTHLLACVAQHPDLILCETAEMETYAQALFRKRESSAV